MGRAAVAVVVVEVGVADVVVAVVAFLCAWRRCRYSRLICWRLVCFAAGLVVGVVVAFVGVLVVVGMDLTLLNLHMDIVGTVDLEHIHKLM